MYAADSNFWGSDEKRKQTGCRPDLAATVDKGAQVLLAPRVSLSHVKKTFSKK